MATSTKTPPETPLKQKIIFFAVLIIGAIIWKFGSVYFVKAPAEPDSDPYEVEQMDVRPL